MKKKIISLGIVSIFLLMGLTTTASKVTKEVDNDNHPPVITQCYIYVSGGGEYIKVKANDPDGDKIRFGIDFERDGEVDIWRGYWSSFTRTGVVELYDEKEFKNFYTGGNVFLVVEDEHGAQSDWVNPSTDPRSKSINNPILNIYEKIFSKFPILQQLIQHLIKL